MSQHVARWCGAVVCSLPWVGFATGCGAPRALADHDPPANGVASTHSALVTTPLVITEVAQTAASGGTTSDKVEVFCAVSGGCASYKVCDTSSSGASCSAAPPALRAPPRAGVSRRSSITATDHMSRTDAT